MEQFRLIGEALGALKALMVFHQSIQVNPRQCALLLDAFTLAFDVVSQELTTLLRFDERQTKWKPLESPLKELHRIFREGESYVRQCLEPRDWWGRAIALGPTNDCVEFHLHNLLWCLPVVLEAVEAVAEAPGSGPDDNRNRRLFVSKKYDTEWTDPQLFRYRLGKSYMSSGDFLGRLECAVREDRWFLSEKVSEMRGPEERKLSRHESQLAELLTGPRGRLYPTSILVGSPDYQVRRRFGAGGAYKEVQWLGESFAVRHFIGDVGALASHLSVLSSVAHPNVMGYLHSFVDEEKRECFSIMELMSKDLSTHIKEVCSAKRKIYLPLLVAVDTMLQIARGMEYLHSRGIYHGDLVPSNILVRPRGSGSDGYLHVKVSGFGMSTVKASKGSQAPTADPCIWYAPEVLQEQERSADGDSISKYSEKADVYSFAMICFELLTGKIPFEDGHLQGDKMSKNIRAGERPLFSFQCPKYLVNLTKRCWHSEPGQRPSFSSLCRVLRYIKRFLVLNPEHGQAEGAPVPPLDYFDIELSLCRRFPEWTAKKKGIRVSEVPFQMYVYRVVEREKTCANVKERSEGSGSDGSNCGDESTVNGAMQDDSEAKVLAEKKSTATKVNGKASKQGPMHKSTSMKSPQVRPWGRSFRNSEQKTQPIVMRPSRRRGSGHASDSELV